MKTDFHARLFRRLPALVVVCAAAIVLSWAFCAEGVPNAQASDAGSAHPLSPPDALQPVPLPTLLSPIYPDTYEINNYQSIAYSMNPGFPYASIQCGSSATFTDASPLIDNATFYQATNPVYDIDWYNLELTAGYFFTISIRNKVSGSPVLFNVQLKSPGNADVPPAPMQGAAPNISFFAAAGGRYQLGLAVYNAASIGSGTENYPYQVFICSSGTVAATATPIPPNKPISAGSPSADSLEPNNTISEAQNALVHGSGLPSFIAVGQSVPGLSFVPYSETDFVSFYARSGSVYEASTENVQPGVETILSVYMPVSAGQSEPTQLVPVTSGSSNPNNRWQSGIRGSKVTFVAPSEGLYWIKIVNSDQSPRTASQTYSLKLAEIVLATPTPYAGSPDRLEYNGSFDNASLIAPGVKIDGLNFVPFNPTSSTDTDNDYYKLPVKQGVFYTCETDDLGGGADTNIIVYNGDRIGIGGNDDLSPEDRLKGIFRSRFSWLSAYTGYAYVLVGQVNPTAANESGSRTYSMRCSVGLPNTPTPVAGATSGAFTPATPLPPEATPTPFPTNRPAQNLVFRQVDGARPVATPTPQPPPRTVTLDVAVFADVNRNLANDLNEGISGASVRVADEQSGAPLAQVVTDPAGRVRIIVLNEGPVRVSIPLFGVSVLIRDPSVLINVAVNAAPELPDRLP